MWGNAARDGMKRGVLLLAAAALSFAVYWPVLKAYATGDDIILLELAAKGNRLWQTFIVILRSLFRLTGNSAPERLHFVALNRQELSRDALE